MRFFKVFIILFVATFGSLYWLLTRPTEVTIQLSNTPPIASAVSTKLATTPPTDIAQDLSQSGKQEMVKKMARYLEQTQKPKPVQMTVRPSGSPLQAKNEVFGFSLDAHLRKTLASQHGFHDFQETIGNGADSAIYEAEEAFKREVYRNREEHLALLELTDALSKSSHSPSATATSVERLSQETKVHLEPGENQDLDYAGRAMQYYLNNEQDVGKKLEFMKSLGVEVIVSHPASENQ